MLAVGFRLGLQDEVAPLAFRLQETAAILDVNRTLDDFKLTLPARHDPPAGQVFAVEQRLLPQRTQVNVSVFRFLGILLQTDETPAERRRTRIGIRQDLFAIECDVDLVALF